MSKAAKLFFTPRAPAAADEVVARLVNFLQRARASRPADGPHSSGGVVVLSGAGCSTESGIPDYRSPNGSYSVGHKPVTHQEFMRCEATRKRYWARSLAGWQYFYKREPNASHMAVKELQNMNYVQKVITQNVDGLHTRVGSEGTVELHGRNFVVRCMDCNTQFSRNVFQKKLLEINSCWAREYLPAIGGDVDVATIRADGDAALDEADFDAFHIPRCTQCGASRSPTAADSTPGIIKPDVVFFGGNLEPRIRDAATAAVRESSGMLLLGTSAQVFSAYRLCRLAVEQLGLPLAIVNIGETRADHLAEEVIEARVGDILPRVVQQLRDSNF